MLGEVNPIRALNNSLNQGKTSRILHLLKSGHNQVTKIDKTTVTRNYFFTPTKKKTDELEI